MSKEELHKLISLRRESLGKSYQKGEAYEFFKEFITNNSCGTITEFFYIDILGFLQCRYYLRSNNKDFGECKQIVKGFFLILDDFSLDFFNNFIDMCGNLKKDRKLRCVNEYFEETRFIKSMLLLREIYPDNKEIRGIIEETKKLILNDNEGRLIMFFKLLREEYDLLLEVVSLLKVYKEIRMIDENRFGECNLSEKELEKEFNKRIKGNVKFSTIKNIFSKFTEFICDVDALEEKYKRDSDRELRGLENLEDLLDRALADDEVINAREIFKSVEDEELRYAILMIIYEHNMKYYQSLEEEYNHLGSSDCADYQKLLEEYHIKIDLNIADEIKGKTTDDVRKILDFISRFDFEALEVIDILKNTNLEVVLKIKEQIDNGIFSNEFIESNRDLFYVDLFKFDLYFENIKLLEQYSLNPYSFGESLEILFADSNLLRRNLDEMKRYELLKFMKTTTNYNFLIYDNLDCIIDKWLELGYEEMLEEDLGLLNYGNLKRLEVLKAMGTDILFKDNLEKTLKGNFFIDDSELDNYIPSIVDYKDKINLGSSFTGIEMYRSSFRTYNFNGVLISSIKTIRLLNEGRDLYDAIFSNSNLSEDEYRLVIDCIRNKELKKK